MNRITDIAFCFFEGSLQVSCEETLWEANFRITGILAQRDKADRFISALLALPPHPWSLAISLEGQEAPHTLVSSRMGDSDAFLAGLNAGWVVGEEAELTLTIRRTPNEDAYHLVRPDLVIKWLSELPVPEALLEFTQLFGRSPSPTLCHPSFSNDLGSNAFVFAPEARRECALVTPKAREDKALLRREQTLSDWGKLVLFPEDFEWLGGNSQPSLQRLFARLSNFLVVMSIADATLADGAADGFHIRIKGHRLREQDLSWKQIPESPDLALLQVYKWCYSAGGAGPLPDKLGLARNFISLYWDDGIFGLSLQVVAAVRGGYELYLKRNLKEYVELRAKVTSTILEIDGRVSKAVETAAGNLEKNFYGLATFVTSVLLIKAMTAKEFTGAFTPQVATLGYIMIAISALHAVYAAISAWGEFTRSEQLYEDLRRQYSQFFTPTDWDALFGSEGNSPMTKTKAYLKSKLQWLMAVWGVTLGGAALTIRLLTKA